MARERAEKRRVKSSLVFSGRNGPLADIRDSLKGACERAGVPHICIHELRHTFGSQMGMAGADPFAIMKALGHSDPQMTMHYVSLGKSHIREQVEKLNAIHLLPSSDPRLKALPASACGN
jgi:integrase